MMPNQRDLSFATFNLENLHTPGGLTYGGRGPFADDAAGRAAYAKKIDWVAQRITLLDADTIAFQELWSAAALDLAFDRAGLRDAYDLVARDAPGEGRPQVALAVRKEPSGASRIEGTPEWIAEFPAGYRFDGLRESDGSEEEITITVSRFSRPVLSVAIQPQGERPTPPPVRLFVAHLKSKGPARLSFARPLPEALGTFPSITRSAVSHVRRVMEAGALRAILDGVMADGETDTLSPTVVLGDLNDGTLAITTQLITGEPGYRVMEKSRAGERSDRGLYSVEQLQQYRSLRHVYYTYVYRNRMESLDHILVSEEFYDHSRKRRWSFRNMEVLNDHLADGRFDTEGASDHGLVRARFDWNPMPDRIA